MLQINSRRNHHGPQYHQYTYRIPLHLSPSSTSPHYHNYSRLSQSSFTNPIASSKLQNQHITTFIIIVVVVIIVIIKTITIFATIILNIFFIFSCFIPSPSNLKYLCIITDIFQSNYRLCYYVFLYADNFFAIFQ